MPEQMDTVMSFQLVLLHQFLSRSPAPLNHSHTVTFLNHASDQVSPLIRTAQYILLCYHRVLS